MRHESRQWSAAPALHDVVCDVEDTVVTQSPHTVARENQYSRILYHMYSIICALPSVEHFVSCHLDSSLLLINAAVFCIICRTIMISMNVAGQKIGELIPPRIVLPHARFCGLATVR